MESTLVFFHRLVTVCLFALTSLLLAPTSVAAASCGSTVVSDPMTLWTDESPVATQGLTPILNEQALLFPSVVVGSPGPITAAQPIWKSSPVLPYYQSSTLAPVVFTRTFNGCGPSLGTLQITGDDSYQAFLNGVLVAQCGQGPLPVLHLVESCDTFVQTVPAATLSQNVLVVLAWNQVTASATNPANIQYRIDY